MTGEPTLIVRGFLAAVVAAAGLVASCSLVNSVDEPLPPLPTGGAAPGGAAPGGGHAGTGQAGAAQAGGGQGGAAGSTGGSGGAGGVAAHCTDSVLNESETDVDCGGGECPPCENGLGCLLPSDCQSQFCEAEEPHPLCAPCVDDQNCLAAPGTYCEGDACVSKKSPGELCTGPNECLSDFCVDGVCCDAVCDGSCDACNLPGLEGTCSPVDAGEAGDPACAPYLCDGTLGDCPDTCSGPDDCTTDSFCQSSQCLGQKDPGDSCVNDGECLSQNCVDEVCCLVTSCGTEGDCNICLPGVGTCGDAPAARGCEDGLYCNGPDQCDAIGNCVPTDVDPCAARIGDGDANCNEACDETNDTCTEAEPDSTPCNDTIYCNGTDVCVLGSCASHAGDPCAANVGDADSNCAESCNETADDCSANDPNGSACSDGTYCNGADTCSNGSCAVHLGDPCPGPDGDANCAESCNETGDNCSANDPAGAVCNDGSYCNGTDSCSSGSCATHSGNPCPGPDGDSNCAESCDETGDSCGANDANGSACTDGLYCNGADTCASGSCSGHAGSPCPGPDGDSNCVESCNETADDCSTADPNGSACNDGTYCNGADTCSAGACSTHPGDPCPGPDGDSNCAESCNEANDNCTLADPNGSACTDSLYCNGTDSCSSGNCSTHSGNPCPGPDGDSNCAESCNETNDNCTLADTNGSACNDNLYCNGTDTCSSGSCSTHSGTPCPGPDGDSNCAESCNETSDNCLANDANGAACNDGTYCNGADTCSAGACSGHSGNPCPGPDGDSNCAESCNETNDNCTLADTNGSACNDNLYCNGTDACSAGACTTHSGNPCPGADGDSDCTETCYETGDNCTAADPNGTTCGTYQSCQGGNCLGCLNGGLVPPSSCTTGTDPGTGSPWVVCSANCSEAWISANNGGTYHHQLICQNLGYNNVTAYGGTCGNVCGYCEGATSCSSNGNKFFGGGGECGSDALGPMLCVTVMWLCTM